MDGASPAPSPDRGRFLGRAAPQRPPWASEGRIRAACTSCGACARACPEAIILEGPARTPVVDFTQGACTFCGACAEACGEDVFADIASSPWSITAAIGDGCLMSAGIACRICTDACDAEALIFDMRVRPAGAVFVRADTCTGCGACIGVCPVSALKMEDRA